MFFYGTVLMGMPSDTFWSMSVGLFLDLWACYRQWHGIDKPKQSIDQIIPF
jgi:hypothetical protein